MNDIENDEIEDEDQKLQEVVVIGFDLLLKSLDRIHSDLISLKTTMWKQKETKNENTKESM